MFFPHQDVVTVSAGSVLASTLLRKLWAYFRKNGLKGKVTLEWEFGPAPKPSKAAPAERSLSG
jgi:hypothetical protein